MTTYSILKMSAIIFLGLRILLVLALYTFIGFAFWLLWKDLRHKAKTTIVVEVPTISLTLEGATPEKSFHFTTATILIGRDPACECHLEEITISSKHARLYYDLSQWWVEDMRSTNGTYLNQEPVTSPMVLTDGDYLRCGQITFIIGLEALTNEHEKNSVIPA